MMIKFSMSLSFMVPLLAMNIRRALSIKSSAPTGHGTLFHLTSYMIALNISSLVVDPPS